MLLGDGTEAYGSGKRVHAGPVGAVMDFSRMVGDHDEYRGNALSDAQMLLAKYGKANASDAVLAWAENRTGSRGKSGGAVPVVRSSTGRDGPRHEGQHRPLPFERGHAYGRKRDGVRPAQRGGAPGVEAIPWRGPGRCAGERGEERDYGERANQPVGVERRRRPGH